MNGIPRWLTAVFAIAFLALPVGGVWFYHTQEQSLRREVEADLQAIAQLKMSQISQWRADRMGDAAVIMGNPFLVDDLAQWMTAPQTDTADKVLTWFRSLQKNYDYSDILLMDVRGQVLLSLSRQTTWLCDETQEALAAAFRERRPKFIDLHRISPDLPVHVDIVAPLFAGSGKASDPIGAILLRSDAERFLYPLIQSWPTSSSSAETLLVRRDGNAVLFLNELRHQSHTALKLRIPLTQENVPAVMAVQGKEGVLEGPDYRGVDVLSVLSAIPDSPWFMVAKMDREEALLDWRFRSALIVGLILGLVAAVAAAMGMIWQRYAAAHYRARFLAEAAQYESEERYRTTLMSIGDGVIVTDAQGRVTLMNPVAEALIGQREGEARRKPIEEVFPIINEDTRQPVENPVSRVLREGVVVGLANHTVLIAQDGKESPIADSGAPIHNERGEIAGVVLVFRDRTEERRAEAELQRNQRLLERAQEIAEIGWWEFDFKKGTVWASPSAQRIYGLDGNERTIDEVQRIPLPEYRPALDEEMDGLIRCGEPYDIEFRISRPTDGALVDIRSQAEYDSAAQKVFGVIRNITERKRSEAALRENEARYRSQFENNHAVMLVVDPESGLIVEANPAAAEFYGWSREELAGMKVSEINTLSSEEIRAEMEKARSSRCNYFEFRHRRADGSIRDVEVFSGKILVEGRDLLYSIVHDVTDRKRMEEALSRSEERFRLFYERAPVAYQSLDGEGRFLEVNPAWLEMMGYERGEVCGRSFGDFLGSEHVATFRKWFPVFKARGEVRGAEFDLVRKDGSVVTVSASGRTACDEQGTFRQTHCVLHNITDRKRAEEERKKLQAQLLQSQKLESVGRLAGGVAHDLNNLLSPILGYGEMLLEDLDPEDIRREPINQMVRAGLRARDLVRHLLAFGRQQTLKIETVNLNTVVAGFEKLLRRTIREDIKIETAPALEISAVRADVGQIEQVIMNLSVNAQDAMIEGGKITIETAEVELDQSYAKVHPGVTPGRYVMLSVSDNGCGMTAEVREQIFTPFFTTKGKGKGTGLGLATVYGIVKQHGGNIWVYSEPGEGTTFKIYLPAVEAPAQDAAATHKTSGDLRGDETVMVVEDNDMVRSMAVEILVRLGYSVLSASGGAECLALLSGYEGSLDLLLTDVVMPGMNGKALFEQVEVLFPGTKVLYMSGYTENVIAHRGVLHDGVDFIQKPFTVQCLAARVREVLDSGNSHRLDAENIP